MTLAVADHNVPTTERAKGIANEESRIQVETLEDNVRHFGVPYFPMTDIRQGVVHIIGPEQGFTQPGVRIIYLCICDPLFPTPPHPTPTYLPTYSPHNTYSLGHHH